MVPCKEKRPSPKYALVVSGTWLAPDGARCMQAAVLIVSSR